MERDTTISPETLRPVEPHGSVPDEELENVRIDGPEFDEALPIAPNPEVEIDGD